MDEDDDCDDDGEEDGRKLLCTHDQKTMTVMNNETTKLTTRHIRDQSIQVNHKRTHNITNEQKPQQLNYQYYFKRINSTNLLRSTSTMSSTSTSNVSNPLKGRAPAPEVRARTVGQDKRLDWWNTVCYNSMAPLYNSLDWMTCGAWWTLQSRALEYIEEEGPSRILEVGFGPGRLFCQMAKDSGSGGGGGGGGSISDKNHRRIMDGIDLAKGMCDFTRQRLEKEGLDGTIVQGSVYDLPYSSNTFDDVVTTFAFSGFSDGQLAMKEMVRVTKLNGKVVIVDIGLPSDKNKVGMFWAQLWEWCGDYLYDLPKMMQEAGLNVEEFEEYGPGKHIRVVVGRKQK